MKKLSRFPGMGMNRASSSGLSPLMAAVYARRAVDFLLYGIPDGLVDYNQGPGKVVIVSFVRGNKRITEMLLSDKRVLRDESILADLACYVGSSSLVHMMKEMGFWFPNLPEESVKQAWTSDCGVRSPERLANAEDMVLEDERKDLNRCSRCLIVWYCSSSCQTAHWTNGHSRDCVRDLNKLRLLAMESNDFKEAEHA